MNQIDIKEMDIDILIPLIPLYIVFHSQGYLFNEVSISYINQNAPPPQKNVCSYIKNTELMFIIFLVRSVLSLYT